MTENNNNLVSIAKARKQLRNRLVAKKAQRNVSEGLGTNQVNPEEGVFSKKELERFNLLSPPYDPAKLMRIAENSTMLGTCIEAYKENIDGYGHEFRYLGTKENEKNEDVQAEKQMLQDFFSRVNESQSFKQLRKELRVDYETTGNAFIEIVRFPTGQIATLYRADPRYIRIQKKQSEYQTVKVSFPRNGKRQTIRINRRFRKYAMVVQTLAGGTKADRIRWFKEYGDPRRMDAKTGKYENELDPNEEIEEEANELLHWKQGNDVYGVPRWAGILPVVLGVNKADYVNYDLFDSNAIPALAILVSGGYLTQDSIDDIGAILEGQKGIENWHKLAILEAVSTNMNEGELGDAPTKTQIDIQELNKPTDAEFNAYISNSEHRIRSKFRLPPIQVGQAEQYSRATADSSKLVSEEQVFQPKRDSFDELINFSIVEELGAVNFKFHTIGPKMMQGDDMLDAYAKMARGGALSVNDGVRIANRVLDLDLTKYSGEWANLPVSLIQNLINRGFLTGIDGVGAAEDDSKQKSLHPLPEEQALNPDDLTELSEKIDIIYSLLNNMEFDPSVFEK